MTPHVRVKKRCHDQVGLASDERFRPASPAVRFVHEPGDAPRISEGLQRVPHRIVLPNALQGKVADFLFEVGGKLVDHAALGARVEVQMSLDFVEVAADLRSHDLPFSPPRVS